MNNDCISRQAAIDALADMHCKSDEDGYVWIIRSDAWARIDALPSAQPERLTDYSFEESCTECPAYDTENHRCPRFNQVIRTALKDANLEPCEDTISRQAAIDALHMHLMYRMGTDSNKKRLDEWINNLPSVQPEIIRCRECKNWREDHTCREHSLVSPMMAYEFCSRAERREK